MARGYTWVKDPKPPKNMLSKAEKAELLQKVTSFVEEHFTAHIQPPPKGHKFNYVTDYFAKWHGPYVIISAKYACPGPNALSPEFDAPLARLGYFPSGLFNLWARRHNDEWPVLDDGLTLEECFERLATNPWFQR